MPGERTDGAKTRYHSLDALRAAAMLLGVAWHAMPGYGPWAVPAFMDWVPSFRMPLFMVTSGFFGHRMLVKYGLGRYLTRRWWRIATPMLFGLFTFMPHYHGHGPMARMFSGPGGPGGPPGFAAGSPVRRFTWFPWRSCSRAGRALKRIRVDAVVHSVDRIGAGGRTRRGGPTWLTTFSHFADRTEPRPWRRFTSSEANSWTGRS
jgi:hypothetical protein